VQRAKERHAGSQPDLTGLGRLRTLDHFAGQVHAIQKRLPALSPADRLTALGGAASAELKAVGVPGFLIVDQVSTEFKGFFSPGTWAFSISDALVSGNSLSDDDAAEMTNTALHEARHAEQAFLTARFSAGVNKKDADGIVNEQHIPKAIATQAVAKKFTAKTDPDVVALGKQMYQASVIDAAINQRISVEDGLAELKTKRDAAQSALDALNASPTAQTVAEATAARDALRAQITEVEQRYTAYRNIPYEADAHEVGDAAEQAFRDWK
jgi:hypothetical protein